MKRIRVLEVVEATAGGTRRHVTELVCNLDAEKFDVSVLCSTLRDPGYLADIEAMHRHGARVTVAPMVRNISPLRDAVAFYRIWRHIRGGGYDVVHTHSSKAGFLGRLAAAIVGVRAIIHTPHTFAFQMGVNPALKALYRLLERRLSRLTHRYACVSRSEQESAVAAGLETAGKCVVIENGLPESAFSVSGDPERLRRELGLAPDDLVVGTAGRFEPQKGLHDLMRAAVRVVKQVPRVQFVLMGEGSLLPSIRELRDRLGLQDRVRLPGEIEQAASFYSAFDVFVLSSLWESLPYSLLEAMAAGNAIVATRVGGVPDALVQDESGLLVPPADPEALADALVYMLTMPGRRADFGAAARQRAHERFRLDEMVRKIEALYVESAHL